MYRVEGIAVSPNDCLGWLVSNGRNSRRMSEADITEEDVAYQEALGRQEGPRPLVVLGTHLNVH